MLKEIVARLRRLTTVIDATLGLLKSPQKQGSAEYKAAIARAENTEAEAIAEIERLEHDRPRALLESEGEWKALLEAIAAAEHLRLRSRAAAEALAAPLAAAEAEEEQARCQAICEKGRAAVAAYQKTFLAAYRPAHAALAALVEAAREPRRLRNDWAANSEERYVDIAGFGLMAAVRAIENAVEKLPTPEQIESHYLAGGPEQSEIEFWKPRGPDSYYSYTPRPAELNPLNILDGKGRDVSTVGMFSPER